MGSGPSSTPSPCARCISSDEQDRINLANVEELAHRLARCVQKYPKNRRGIQQDLWVPRERYVALTTFRDESCPGGQLEKWRQGSLVYWQSRRDHLSGAPPKGSISLLKILKVQHDQVSHDGRGVVIKHHYDGHRKEMLLLLSTKVEAREFAYKLWEFISKVRSEWSLQCEDSISRAPSQRFALSGA
jgi:hypothetical protein